MRLLPTASLLVLGSLAACAGDLPSSPSLFVTSPARGLMQDSGAAITVTGTTGPSIDGDPVTAVSVNGVAATLASDGSFTATVTVPDGATLLETIATTSLGGRATDARAVQSGQRMPVGNNINSAVQARLSADVFAKLSAATGPFIKKMDLPALLTAIGPISTGSGATGVTVNVKDLAFGDVKVVVKPLNGGLSFSAEIDDLDVHADAKYALGSTTAHATATSITISGTLVVTPNGTQGFTTSIAQPTVTPVGMSISATGITDTILSLVQDTVGDQIKSLAVKAAEGGIQPMMNEALGALGGPKSFPILDTSLDLEASPAAVSFTEDGALVAMNLMAKIEGSESSPGFIQTQHGQPSMGQNGGIQVALSEDLLNEMLAEVHAMGLLDLHVAKDLGFVDSLDLQTALPPMICADTDDGSMRLILGDMIATLGDHGSPFATVAVNASVDVKIEPSANPSQIALEFGDVHLFVNDASDPNNPSTSPFDFSQILDSGIDVQMTNLKAFLINIPTPSIEGMTLADLELHADNGYVMVSGDLH